MNILDTFQSLVAQVPEIVQPLIVALAGAIPFIEGEGAASIGIIGGIPPVIAAAAAMIGNFLCVAVLVLAGAGARQAIVARSRARRVTVGAGEEPPTADADVTGAVADSGSRAATRRAKFMRAFERYGVPGVSLLGPLLLPTQFTATMLAAAGVGKARILLWQGIAIFGWTTVVAVIVGSAVSAVS